MCCSEHSNEPEAGTCIDCGEPIDQYGIAIYSCSYSPVSCETCEHQGCDGSC